ncbi:aromatic ring-hydroxylating oxygenase subunit alpha [Niallia endozanthoxylica]|uniref:Rieske 2Fe-2S domain-containing protein n=1 Tax=Niallia endozanthoxylica TaxID=2036016 RepID=A0A5J5HWE7_9BACI|nr:aromatic ring-hydroxylating dioxygenase subunit alpha [Niallia endozanthoxylica]KAA9027032.1 Rieske 2Fe-2S domain-containing protein [Niallia endozanthoxylica]
MKKFVVEDKLNSEFLVHRSVFTEQQILEREKKEIFSKCWLYIGHESEIPKNGDFVRRKVGGRNLLFTRGSDGVVRALYNSCTHRGALVCRENKGNTKVFRCFYHAWSFTNKGELVGMPGKDGFSETFNCNGSKNLKEVTRLESYREFVFVNFDDNAISLDDYLGNAKEYLDLVADQSELGMEVLLDPQEYSVRANWKLLSENSVDSYHGMPTHKTYFEIVATRGGELSKGDLQGVGLDLGNGHAVVEYTAPWGRPVGRWIPAWGEEGQKEIDEITRKLENKFGKERAERITQKNRNLLIFPNLVINDIMAITIRTFYPIEPGYMEVTGYALAAKGENEEFRRRRNDNFLEFIGPGGFATPDDNEALELCQEGFLNNQEVEWNDISKGMIREQPLSNDEEQMRGFWRKYNEILSNSNSINVEEEKVKG